ncbi:MAG: TrmH family RNA methyltransferase [Candidatus Acidiferrales bacterium]
MFRAALHGTGPTGDEPLGIEGPRLVEEALRSGLEADALLVSDTGEHALEGILRAAAASEAGIPRPRILRTTDKLFEGVAETETPQGVAALFRQPQWGFEDVLNGSGASRGSVPLVVVLAGVQDPGNVGTIVRSAEAFGATGAVAARGTADPWSPKALRASAGSALRLPVLRGMAIPVLLAQLKIEHARILAASVRAEGVFEFPAWALHDRLALFIGSEGRGLPAEVEHAADAVISIPVSEPVESLNAAVAASVLLYEISRRRKKAATEETE